MKDKTKILATIGPASQGKISQLIKAGIWGIRINASHGDFSQHKEIIKEARLSSKDIVIVYDIKGPKIRLGDLTEPVYVKEGDLIVLNCGKNSAGDIPVGFPQLCEFVKAGHRLLIDDGLISVRVEKVRPPKIYCRVLYGNVIRSRKGINHPDTVIDFPYTVSEDVPRIEFAIEQKVAFIADSFTRSAEDVRELRGRVGKIKIISKIENPQGVNNFDGILKETDVVMVARGDLGVEFDPWEIPPIQRRIVKKCNRAKKPVAVATQMLDSMIENPRPSRSDVSDIANAVWEGADILTLTSETSIGKFPVECVEVMRKIIEEACGSNFC